EVTEREIFATDGELIICTLSDEDRKDYVELHRQLNGETSLYLNPRSKDMINILFVCYGSIII
ncbi:MAG: hypothetical protein NC541_12055, partial [bacterium]|nr:hypothetical protein [bacterium]